MSRVSLTEFPLLLYTSPPATANTYPGTLAQGPRGGLAGLQDDSGDSLPGWHRDPKRIEPDQPPSTNRGNITARQQPTSFLSRPSTYTHAHTSNMFGAFRMTSPLSSGLLWKIPWRLSKFQKRRHRERLRAVDDVIATVDAALAKKGETVAALERWKAEMPTEAEMLPRDKYTMFDRKEKKYRKGIHSITSQVDESFAEIEPAGLLD
ncbi:uncharacterized protein CLUP02_03039 [Colletotrichum lupini]|uniref:54S ribosomal protein L31, mitochondrial n=1 Tax=Colletotrichum lupini TaxID=145971 RepID=A0A9Q8WCG8_9PEZI|nr:uncharacterized protein CLUP02_03039 [Colletotrichum lupini]UQC77570.1 hypothetical protein CLUP02_03039 [Colletotrichum lupini]